jgi:putative aldouronate transport system permease protein
MPSFTNALRNTLIISLLKLLFVFPAPIAFALMLNEIRSVVFKRVSQTLSYLPYFLSWVVASGIIYNILSPGSGAVNTLLLQLGVIGEPVHFMGDKTMFYPLVVLSEIWKELGWGSIIYLAALTAIDPSLYEAARVDGAGRIRQMWHVSLPGMRVIMILLFILAVSNILNAGFDQIQAMQNKVVLEVSDILDTLILRTLTVGGMRDISLGAAMGLFKMIFGIAMFVAVNMLFKKLFKENMI